MHHCASKRQSLQHLLEKSQTQTATRIVGYIERASKKASNIWSKDSAEQTQEARSERCIQFFIIEHNYYSSLWISELTNPHLKLILNTILLLHTFRNFEPYPFLQLHMRCPRPPRSILESLVNQEVWHNSTAYHPWVSCLAFHTCGGQHLASGQRLHQWVFHRPNVCLPP